MPSMLKASSFGSTMKEDEFYSRQINLKELGSKGQKLLKDSRVLVVGAGGLGHPVGGYLSAAGVGKITLLDFDRVEISNLNRQVYFTEKDLGLNKCEILRDRLKEKNPFIEIDSINMKLSIENAKEVISDYDIIVDCCDNFSTKFLIHDCCWILNKALVQGSVYQYEGQLQVFDFRSSKKKSVCLRCLWPKLPSRDSSSNCEQSGIIGGVVGTLGSMQALEVIKLITGISTNNPHGITYTLNLLNLDMQRVKWSKKTDCPLCSVNPIIKKLEFSNYHSIEKCEVQSIEMSYGEILDIREEYEKTSSYPSRPLSKLELWKKDLSPEKSYTFVCSTGLRSLELTKRLNAEGYNCFSLYGGLKRLYS